MEEVCPLGSKASLQRKQSKQKNGLVIWYLLHAKYEERQLRHSLVGSYWERLELDAVDDPCDFRVTVAAFLIKDRWKLEGIS